MYGLLFRVLSIVFVVIQLRALEISGFAACDSTCFIGLVLQHVQREPSPPLSKPTCFKPSAGKPILFYF